MRNALTLAAFIALAPAALAKPWNGIDPGTSKKDEVIKKFGDPSKVVKSDKDAKETLAYLGEKAIKGTTQAQFKVDAQSGTVERIDVFPGPVIDKDMVESSYGAACPSAPPMPKDPCYVKKITDNFKAYFVYVKLGLAVFFKEDNKTVSSFVFTAMSAPRSAGPAAPAAPGGSAGSGAGATPPASER
ncbi:MAG TPA: hypothetical protein VND93_05125 [Myxococcales bacterium]|nr:hypothetical protein [Myxococcales bacterium]